MDKKKLIIIGSVVAIILSIVAIIYIITNNGKENEYTIDGINLPENKEILKDATIKDLKITNISLLTRDGTSSFKATITNENETEVEVKTLYVIFYEGEQENKTIALYNTKIPSKEEKYINITSETDLSKTTKIEYVLE